MHLLSPYLDLKGLPYRTHKSCVKGLVHIRLWHSNIVLKPPRNRCIHLMNHTKSRIAVLNRIHNNTHCKQIVYLIHRLILVHHLLINTEEMLHTPTDITSDTGILHMSSYFLSYILYKFLPLRFSRINLIYQLKEHLRLGVFKSQVIKLCLNS